MKNSKVLDWILKKEVVKPDKPNLKFTEYLNDKSEIIKNTEMGYVFYSNLNKVIITGMGIAFCMGITLYSCSAQ